MLCDLCIPGTRHKMADSWIWRINCFLWVVQVIFLTDWRNVYLKQLFLPTFFLLCLMNNTTINNSCLTCWWSHHSHIFVWPQCLEGIRALVYEGHLLRQTAQLALMVSVGPPTATRCPLTITNYARKSTTKYFISKTLCLVNNKCKVLRQKISPVNLKAHWS